MTNPNHGLFVVEHRLLQITESELKMLQAALSNASARLTARGEAVTYLGSTFLPGSHRLFSLFRAANAEIVRKASDSSHAPLTGLEPAIDLPPQAGATK